MVLPHTTTKGSWILTARYEQNSVCFGEWILLITPGFIAF